MRQRFGLADVLIKNPEVIILDEPTMGIDSTGVCEFLELIVKLSKEEGIAVLFSSHPPAQGTAGFLMGYFFKPPNSPANNANAFSTIF